MAEGGFAIYSGFVMGAMEVDKAVVRIAREAVWGGALIKAGFEPGKPEEAACNTILAGVGWVI